jgi:hypothetical protein
MIQIIGHAKKSFSALESDDCIISRFNAPKSFDEFEINIIDLDYEGIWCNGGDSNRSIDNISDFTHMGKIIENSHKSKYIVILPQNCIFYYNSHGTNPIRYWYNKQLKDMLSELVSHLVAPIIKYSNYNLLFEPTTTKINGLDYSASFYITGIPESNRKTFSYKSEKTTTVVLPVREILLTTLNILSDNESLLNYLGAIGLLSTEEQAPEWIQDIEMFDDKEQKEKIESNNNIIQSAKTDIETCNAALKQNASWKSILYTSGQQLVNSVFEMLESLLQCDLSDFVDEKHEDFNISKDDITFVGEIKGVSTNVKNGNISQLEVH